MQLPGSLCYNASPRFSLDKSFLLPKSFGRSTSINTLLISLILQNWRPARPWQWSKAEQTASMPTLCHGQKGATSAAPCPQHAGLPGCSSQDSLFASLTVSWEHLLEMCLQSQQLEMAVLHLPCQLPLPLSPRLARLEGEMSTYASSACGCECSIPLEIMRIPDPQGHGEGSTWFEKAEHAFFCCLWLCCIIWD